MRAIYYEKFRGSVSLETVADPQLPVDGIILKVEAAGLCLSDWHGWMGHDADIHLPHVPGHEFAGTIAAVGSNTQRFKLGDRVTVPFVSGCGHCMPCRSGDQHICDAQFQPGFTAWGAFAEYVALDYADQNVVHLPDTIDFVTAASLGCRFATAFRAVVDQGRLKGGEWMAVFGCGGVGLSAIMIGKALGANIVAVDIRASKLKMAQRLGANILVNASKSISPVEEIKAKTNGGVQLSIDAIGHRDALFQGISCLRKRGRHVQVGILAPEEAAAPVPMDQIIARELEIYGSHGMQAYRYPEMIAMMENGQLKPQELVAKTVSLEEAASILPVLDTVDFAGVQVIDQF